LKASTTWLNSPGAGFNVEEGHAGYAHLQHYGVSYREWGEGPPLVLVPGLAGGYGLLGPLAGVLASRFRVISYQLRGEDDCFALRRRFDLADLVNDLAEFIDWHRLECPVVMGVSFGGVLALEYAARNSHRVDKLVVQGVGARYDNGLLPRLAGAVLSRFPLPSDNPFINQFFNLLFGGKQKPGPLVEFVTQQCWQTDQSVMAYRLRLLEQYDIGQRLKRIRVPTLVLAGQRDLLVSEDSLKVLGEGLPNAQVCPLEGCGHLAFVTHPRRLAQEVERFVTGPR
jgi:pimeloyl-ACP methyl ester carboxylesterase